MHKNRKDEKDEKKGCVEEKEKCVLSKSEDRNLETIRSGLRRQPVSSFFREDF